MAAITSKPDWGARLIENGAANRQLQSFLDELEQSLNADLLGSQVTLPSYEVADLPVVRAAPGMIFVSDEAGGAVPAFSDGLVWRRVTDRAIVS